MCVFVIPYNVICLSYDCISCFILKPVFVGATSIRKGVGCVFVRGVKSKPPVPARRAHHTEDGLTQEQWAPLTRNDAPKTCGLLSPWQPPMGQGSRADSWREEDLQKWSPFLSTESALALYLFALCLSSSPHRLSFYTFMGLTFRAQHSATNKNNWREWCKSSLYELLLLSGIKSIDLTNEYRPSCKISHSLYS